MPRRPFDPAQGRPFDRAQGKPFGRAQGRPIAAPEQLTAADLLRIGLGLLMIPLGVIILVRTLTIAVTVPGVLVGGAFVAFGVHRLWLAWTRYRLYRQSRGEVR
jgi:hypothetical protein